MFYGTLKNALSYLLFYFRLYSEYDINLEACNCGVNLHNDGCNNTNGIFRFAIILLKDSLNIININ